MLTSFHRFRSSTKGLSRASRGFTLIELLVVFSIMAVVSGLLLIRQARFDSATLLRSLSYSVALSVRQSQVYGSSVLGTTTSTGVVYASGYGVYFSSGSPSSYVLFADLDSNGRYTGGEDVKVFTLGTGYFINRFCATNQVDVQRCSPTTISHLSIIFKRPNPDGQFVALDSGGSVIPGDVYKSAYIQIVHQGDTANTRSINVSQTGQISVGGSGS